MTTFNDLGLAEPLLKALAAEGHDTPTPIQAQAIPALIAGKDVLGVAQTGTGKTAAFALPILQSLTGHRAKTDPKACAALVLAPTRELAGQIFDSFKTYGRHSRPSVALITGGVKHGPQIKAMARGVDILVATPGRLLDHVAAGKVRLDLTTRVVLDEADQMLDMGFMPAIKKILGAIPKNRQTMLLSATMPKPIRALADEILSNPVSITVGTTSRPIEQIDQSVILVEAAQKNARLAELLQMDGVDSAIVFTRTKHGADRVCKYLEKAGLNAAALHGDKSQGQRVRALSAFKTGKVAILVATDIAARGIDVDHVSHVFNYNLPMVAEAYVHRIGRTARAGRSGIAITLCDREELGLLRDVQRLIGYAIAASGEVDWLEKKSNGNAQAKKPGRGAPRRHSGGRPGNGGGDGGKNAAPRRNKRPKQRPAMAAAQ